MIGGCWVLDLQAPRSAPLALQVVLPQCFEAALSSPSFAGEERGTEGQTCSKSMAFQRCSEDYTGTLYLQLKSEPPCARLGLPLLVVCCGKGE
jgi:hypothetical protein